VYKSFLFDRLLSRAETGKQKAPKIKFVKCEKLSQFWGRRIVRTPSRYAGELWHTITF